MNILGKLEAFVSKTLKTTIETNGDVEEELHISEEWNENFEEICEKIPKSDSVQESDMQIDNRNLVAEE